MIKSKLITYFTLAVILGTIGLVAIFYSDYKFNTNDLSKNIIDEIANKEKEILRLIKIRYKTDFKAPIKISSKLPNSLFGMATYDPKTKKIVIYLNKNRFKESKRYMIDDVLPHEYAHALMFHFKDFSKRKAGHSKLWQEACRNLNGIRCDRFVNHQDIILGKTNFFD